MIELLVNDTKLYFEHSLVSLSGWEADHEKAFYPPAGAAKISKEEHTKSDVEMMRYFEHMLVRPRKKVHLVQLLDYPQQLALAEYIASTRTASVVREIQSKGQSENISSELIYYWLVAFKIPFFPTETWHLNRLLTLVKICSVKNAPATKQSKAQIAKRAMSMREINEQRLAAMNTKG